MELGEECDENVRYVQNGMKLQGRNGNHITSSSVAEYTHTHTDIDTHTHRGLAFIAQSVVQRTHMDHLICSC